MSSERRSGKVFEPTPREIRRACEKIQQRWSERERCKRAGRPHGYHWTPPLVANDWLSTDASSPVDESPAG